MLVIIHLCSLQGRQLGGILSSGKAGISIRHGGNHYVKQANERALAILNRVKQLESVGYTFEGAEASVHLMILHSARGYCPPFQVLDYSAHVYDSNMDSASSIMMNKENDKSQPVNGSTARATVQVRTMRPQEEFDPFAYPKEEETLPYADHLKVSDCSGPVDGRMP
jgi:2-isopropylmalate synthase